MIEKMKNLPLILCLSHAALAMVVFGLAIADLEHHGMWPLIMFAVDLPVSFIFAFVDAVILHYSNWSSLALCAFDSVVYLAIGSTWYYWIGRFIRFFYEAGGGAD